jgi:hypothetical protein
VVTACKDGQLDQTKRVNVCHVEDRRDKREERGGRREGEDRGERI